MWMEKLTVLSYVFQLKYKHIIVHISWRKTTETRDKYNAITTKQQRDNNKSN